MNEQDNNKPDADTLPVQPKQVDETRRRITRGGAASAGVLLSVASRSAFGTSTWGTCTGSEIASGNLSREGTPRPCGCSPGFWGNMNGKEVWTNPDLIPVIYARGQAFNTVFGVSFYNPGTTTLINAINQQGTIGSWCPSSKVNNMRTVAFHAVAALLNAQLYGSRYPVTGLQSPTAVIAAFQTAFSAGPNGLTAFMTRVDVYSTGVWCNGAES